MNELWIVMQWKGENAQPEFQGVFDSEHLAIKACVTDDYYIFPAKLNEELPQEMIKPNGYYPRLETKEQGAKRNALCPPL